MFNKVTISGLVCTGKSTLFSGLVKKLSWPAFSVSQFFRQYAKEHRVSLDKAEEQNFAFTKKVDLKTQALFKKRGNLIIEGWMAGIMAANEKNVLKILLVCDDKVRFSRFAKREKSSSNKAKHMILFREKNLLKKLQEIYNRDDFLSPQNYDLIIDTTVISKRNLLTNVYQKLKEGRR